MNNHVVTDKKSYIITNPPIAQFLFDDIHVAVVWLVVRILLGLEWLQVGYNWKVEPSFDPVRSVQEPAGTFQSLTAREREVLALMVKGMGNNEIAAHLTISLSTTKSHVSSILGKLGLASRTEAIVKVLEHKLESGAFYIK